MHFFFCRLFSEITYAFKPDAIVVQCGADCLTNDPLGGFNLTPLSIANCLKKVVSKSLPTLILGGGGYNKVSIYQLSQLWVLCKLQLHSVEITKFYSRVSQKIFWTSYNQLCLQTASQRFKIIENFCYDFVLTLNLILNCN